VDFQQPVSDAPEPGASDSPEVLERFHTTLDLVDAIAREVRRSLRGHLELEDLIASGREGLLEAARRFETAREVPFRTYATFRVRGAMIDALRRSGALSRRAYQRVMALKAMNEVNERELPYLEQPFTRPDDLGEAEALLRAHVSSLAFAALLASSTPQEIAGAHESDASTEPTPEEVLSHAELLTAVERALGELSQEASAVVRRHYLGGERLEDIARDFDMSKAWASRMLNRSIARLARRLRAHRDPNP
jgi:RNA polymerase sigma factor for flagellar operon FliA